MDTATEVSARIGWFRGSRAVLRCRLRDWALANRALVKRDFEGPGRIGSGQGESRTLYSIVKELGRKRAGFKKVSLEDGSVARDAKQEQRWWLKHFASQLEGSAATEDRPRLPEIGSVVSATCKPPSFDEIADVVAILPKWRATASDGVPNEACVQQFWGFSDGTMCETIFESEAAVRTHMYKVHGNRGLARRFVADTQ